MKILITFGFFLAICVIVAHGSILKPVPQPEPESSEEDSPDKSKHDKFFKSLGQTERIWILRLVLKHEAQKLNNESPAEEDQRIALPLPRRGGSVKPVDEFNLIPEELFEVMLNGHVSDKFQQDMIRWLRRDFGFTDEDFKQFNTRTEQICHNGKCWDLGSIGGQCCPFG